MIVKDNVTDDVPVLVGVGRGVRLAACCCFLEARRANDDTDCLTRHHPMFLAVQSGRYEPDK